MGELLINSQLKVIHYWAILLLKCFIVQIYHELVDAHAGVANDHEGCLHNFYKRLIL